VSRDDELFAGRSPTTLHSGIPVSSQDGGVESKRACARGSEHPANAESIASIVKKLTN